MVLTPLEVCRAAEAVLAVIRFAERGSANVYVPRDHWFVANVRDDGHVCWFMGGMN